MSDALKDVVDNAFISQNVEFEVTEAERELIEAGLLHLSNKLGEIESESDSMEEWMARKRRQKVGNLLDKFDRIHKE